MRAHLVEREQILLRDGLDDVALADAVAAADLGRIGQQRHGVGAGRAGVADVRLAEQNVLAKVVDRRAVAHELEVPRSVDGIAVQHGSLDLVALHDDLLVDAARGVLEHELLGAGAAREVAGREQVDARDLELRRSLRARVAADAELGEVIRDDLRLLEQRRDEAVAGAAVLHALADGVDARIVGLHRVVDEHAALAGDAARLRERRVRPDADGHDDEIGGHFRAVGELDAAHAVLAENRGGLCRHDELEPARLERALQQAPADASSCRSISVPTGARR